MRRYSKKLYTKEQREWCENYERQTTFEPLMCDYEAGNQSFYEAAELSVQWFEDWSSEAYRDVSLNIPGCEDQLAQAA